MPSPEHNAIIRAGVKKGDNMTNLEKIIFCNKEFIKKMIIDKTCINPEKHQLLRCRSLSECKYCPFGKENEYTEKFECDIDAIGKWLDEEVKE